MVKRRANELDGTAWSRYSISVWNDIRKSRDETRLKHPAMFPEMLVTRLLMCFTTEADQRILDPFAGSGSTLMAARELGKYGIGFELVDKYIELSRNRLEQAARQQENGYEIHQADARVLTEIIEPNSIDCCITSPPYWDILNQKRTADFKLSRNYGNHSEDLGHINDYNRFLEALEQVFTNVFLVLKSSRYCIVNVMDIRKKSMFYPLHSDLAQSMQKIGFIFDDIIIWDRRHEYNNLRPLGYPSVFRLNKIHEFLLIFKKP